MSRSRLMAVMLSVAAGALLWACQAAPPEGEVQPAKGGVFADVIGAIETVTKSVPEAGERDTDVPRGEWKLILDARQRFTVPRVVSETPAETDYYEPDEPDTAETPDLTQGDALDVILDAEWAEYTTLAGSVPPGTADPELVKAAEESLADFYRDLPVLMAAVPDTMRERVLHIVVLRYFNTILRAGVDPRLL